jgi:oligoendopeptidase F
VFPDEAAFEEAVKGVTADLPLLAQLAGTLTRSPQALLAALRASETTNLRLRRCYLYAAMLRDGDGSDPANLARVDRVLSLLARYEATTAFVVPELLTLSAEAVAGFLEQEPGLALYRHYFETLDLQRAHTRSTEVEEVLAQAGDPLFSSWQTHLALENADLRFATIKDEEGQAVELAQGNSDTLIGSGVRSVRRAAWRAYADAYLGVKNTMAATLAGAVKANVFEARVRRYPSAREASMAPYNLPLAVFDTLIACVRSHLPLWHRYWGIRRRALGVPALCPEDLHVPLAVAEEEIAYDRGVDVLMVALAPLGQEYVSVARRGLTAERWVDKYPNAGKGSGAHSTGVYGTHPFMMQNYDNSLLSLSTLAHELGHSMHSYLTWATQPPVYSRYSMFAAETASNFNQSLLRAHLLKEGGSPRFQVAVVEEGMANFHRYLFIMPILAQFEQHIHERVERGEGLTAEGMSARLAELYGEGYGPEVVMDEPRVGITWAQFPHLFGNFYVWQYATGISAANALAAGVLADGAPAAERYLQFLKSGGSQFPLDALKLAGVDMTDAAPIERAFGVLEGLIDRLDRLVGTGPLPWLPRPDC